MLKEGGGLRFDESVVFRECERRGVIERQKKGWTLIFG